MSPPLNALAEPRVAHTTTTVDSRSCLARQTQRPQNKLVKAGPASPLRHHSENRHRSLSRT
jgi:hypothetical protein